MATDTLTDTPALLRAHPHYERTIELGPRTLIVCFLVGYHEKPPAEVSAAYAHITATLKTLDAQVEAIRSWGGKLYCYPPSARIVNPPITPEMEADFIATTQAAYPDAAPHSFSARRNAQHGLTGYSVQFTLAQDRATPRSLT